MKKKIFKVIRLGRNRGIRSVNKMGKKIAGSKRQVRRYSGLTVTRERFFFIVSVIIEM